MYLFNGMSDEKQKLWGVASDGSYDDWRLARVTVVSPWIQSFKVCIPSSVHLMYLEWEG